MAGLIIFDPENELAGFTTGDDVAVGAYQDIQSDTLYFTDGVNIYEWAGDTVNNQTYTWLSGEVRLPAPANMGAAIVEAPFYGDPVTAGTIFAVGGDGTDSYGMKSADGETWELFQFTTTANYIYDIEYGSTIGANGRVVAVGGQITGGMSYSDDKGVTWTSSTLPSAGRSICWSPTLELFVYGDSAGDIYSSTDGINWTLRFSTEVFVYSDIVWDPTSALFVAVSSDSSVGIINTSPDGLTWTRNTDPDLSGILNPDTPECIEVDDAGLVVTPSGNPSITPKHAYSTDPDGAWSLSGTNAHPMRDIAYSPTLSLWMGTTSNSDGNFVSVVDPSTSTFGAVANSNSTGGPWRACCWSVKTSAFYFFGSGTGDIIMKSTNGTTFSTPTVPSGAADYTWLSAKALTVGESSGPGEGGGGVITFKLYADGVLKHTQDVISAEPFRLPGGYLSNIYSVEITGTQPVTRVSVAESIFELAEG